MTSEPTRVTIVDHRSDGLGRVFEAWDCQVDQSYQDHGRTLKIFVTDQSSGRATDQSTES